jgi:hypothetical protein
MINELTPRDKLFLIVGGICVIIYCIYVFIADPAYSKLKGFDQQITNKILLIEKYQEILNKKAYYIQKEKSGKEVANQLAKLFLKETKPALAAAGMQKIIEEYARQTSVSIVSTRTDKPKYFERLLAIPVEITVRSTLKNLSQMIALIENHETLMLIEEVKSKRVDNKPLAEELNTKLLIDGFIQELEPEKTKKP